MPSLVDIHALSPGLTLSLLPGESTDESSGVVLVASRSAAGGLRRESIPCTSIAVFAEAGEEEALLTVAQNLAVAKGVQTVYVG